ncbi:hypothetical protein L1987_61725 [Smallanthus sonchifolius]|uniref:Uncharacterized protein n=1 Tax=Smallanthus sonchifolius TaxID=185202 RepID=A0ACB9C8H9_9ASTR|nr:hypothetical protein L1987_61725 [Smallanthus sonchifolius]
MCFSSSVSTFSPPHLPRRNLLFLRFPYSLPILTDEAISRPSNPRRRRLISLSASITRDNLELPSVSADPRDVDDYNGWAIFEETVVPKKQKQGLPTLLLFGIGTSIVALLAVFAQFTLSRKVIEGGKPGRVVVSVSADATQQEALLWLKNLKIIEDEVVANELCSRREYARWLILVNSRLERNRRNRIVPSITLAGSTINAFDDISNEDPDFECIQALAEAGVVLSKLSGKNLHSDQDTKSSGGVNFFPDRCISREDLIGQVKRFQPGKPCTKAQAAVALTSGRITESILREFSKLEAENSSHELAMKEIKSEIIERGEIHKFWEKKIEDENRRFWEVEADYLEAIKYLENQKINQDNANYLKEKAALDCQKQLLSSLKEEVNEMNQRLVDERADHVDDRHKIRSTVSELEVKYEKVLDSKSILEAELEALRILRSWIEDEAKKGEARTKILEEAGRRLCSFLQSLERSLKNTNPTARILSVKDNISPFLRKVYRHLLVSRRTHLRIFVQLARKYIKRVASEFDALDGPDKEPTGRAFCFSCSSDNFIDKHGGFDAESMKAFVELRSCMNKQTNDENQWRI